MSARATLHDLLAGSPYQGYAYGYPHKTAYRAARSASAARGRLARCARRRTGLYVHVPFCAMRCGFCNLFTSVGAARRSHCCIRAAKCSAKSRQCAQQSARARSRAWHIGGGTPTFLAAEQLDAMFTTLDEAFQARPVRAPTSVEASPETVSAEKLAILRRRGVSRLSLGVQSFLDAETKALGRPQKRAMVE